MVKLYLWNLRKYPRIEIEEIIKQALYDNKYFKETSMKRNIKKYAEHHG